MFIINWQWRKGERAYVTKRFGNLKPYTPNPHDKDCRTWKTRAAAERFLARMDAGWAAMCVIEELSK